MRRAPPLAIVVDRVLAPLRAAPGWTWPVDGPVLRPFSLGADPYAAGQHRGIDIGGAVGDSVRAPAAGTVSFVGLRARRRPRGHDPDGRRVRRHAAPARLDERRHEETRRRGRGRRRRRRERRRRHAQPHVHLGVRVAADPDGYVDPLGLLARPVSRAAAGAGCRSQSSAPPRGAAGRAGGRRRERTGGDASRCPSSQAQSPAPAASRPGAEPAAVTAVRSRPRRRSPRSSRVVAPARPSARRGPRRGRAPVTAARTDRGRREPADGRRRPVGRRHVEPRPLMRAEGCAHAAAARPARGNAAGTARAATGGGRRTVPRPVGRARDATPTASVPALVAGASRPSPACRTSRRAARC